MTKIVGMFLKGIHLAYSTRFLYSRAAKGLILTKLFILWINCETLHMKSLTCVVLNEKGCPKFLEILT